MAPITIESAGPDATVELGRRLGAALRGGETVSLIGPLGAGKTHLTKGIALGLGISDEVVSPTYLIHRIYDEGRIRLHHFDFYRLDTGAYSEMKKMVLIK